MPRKSDPTKPKRGFMDGYKTYDTSEGFGSVDEWRGVFEEMTGKQAGVILKKQTATPLAIFELTALPATLADLKKKYRDLMKIHHPDRGGDNDVAKLITAAYTKLAEQIERRDRK